MKFFIASHARSETQELRDKLIEAGHELTLRWVTDDTKDAYPDDERTYTSIIDEEDVEKSRGGLILIAEEEGRWVPGSARPIYVIGREEDDPYHWYDNATFFKDVNKFLPDIIA